MTMTGSAIFFDGKTSARHDVAVELPANALRVRAPDGAVLAEWGYDQLETLSAPDHVLRVGKFGNPVLARLEVRDRKLAAAIDELSEPVDRSGRSERQMRRRIVTWTVAAAAALLLVAVVGLPAIATRLAPLVPYPLERRVGAAVDAEIRVLARQQQARIRLRVRQPPQRASGPGGLRQADAPAGGGGRLALSAPGRSGAHP